MKVTVAICTRNRRAYLEKAVASVLPQLSDESELLIVDNGSSDGTREFVAAVEKTHQRVRLLHEEKAGIPFARNAALRNARGEWVLFFDDDELAPGNWIASYLAFFDRHKERQIGAVGGGCEPHFESAPPAWFYMKWACYDMGPAEIELRDQRTPGAGNCAINRAAAVELGGFSEQLARSEDTDLLFRLQKAGYEVWWLPGAAICHMISGARLTVRALVRMAFTEGRAVGCGRLIYRRGASGIVYRLGRLVISPFYALGLFALSIVTMPVAHGTIAARYLQRAVRSLGIAWQMLKAN